MTYNWGMVDLYLYNRNVMGDVYITESVDKVNDNV
jgi:hypothetical protein